MIKKPTVFLSEIILIGGQKIVFKEKEKIILVGPNNSGKSQTLRDIIEICKNGKNENNQIVLEDIKIEKKGTEQDLIDFLQEKADYSNNRYNYQSWSLPTTLTNQWNFDYLRNGIDGGFIKNITANNRLNICNTKQSINSNQQKSAPQHILYDDSKLMEKISGFFREAFKKDIMIDFRGGSVIPIHVGQLPSPELVDRVGDPYVKAVRANPLLEKQGDGIKSYAGILFETLVSDLDINLLDEPEAFLHPPQMRRLGQTLASQVNGQLIVATHSSDIMRGFLEGTNGQVRILRIRREGKINLIHEADSAVVQELWEKPELKYSNALEGVFHEETILCEDDSDCRLFNAIADYLSAKDSMPLKDTAYVPTGGKHGIKKIAGILRKIGVPIKAVFDMDFLSEKNLVQETVSAFGGDWNEIEILWRRVDAAVRKGIKPKSIIQIKSELISAINECNEDNLPRKEINEIMKQNAPWNKIKQYGKLGIPSGDVQSTYDELKTKLENIGIYLVPVGEVENFCRELGSHGPAFVNKLLTEIPFNDNRLKELRDFVSHICSGKSAPIDQINIA